MTTLLIVKRPRGTYDYDVLLKCERQSQYKSPLYNNLVVNAFLYLISSINRFS